MKRTKKNIVVFIPILKEDDDDLILDAAADAYRYADDIYFVRASTNSIHSGGATKLVNTLMREYGAHVLVNRLPGHSQRFRFVSHLALTKEKMSHPDREAILYYAEVGWRISEPDIVRTTIEYNNGVIAAQRYFQWDEENFRIDGQYQPTRLPIFGIYQSAAQWQDPISTAPTWMWSVRPRWIEAPFYIKDVTFMNPEYRTKDRRTPNLSPIHEKTFA